MVLGITGTTGVGKHTAADFLKQKGWVILDADRIAHHLYRPYTSVWKAITEHFGEEILSKNDIIDRQKLGQIVFNPENPEKAGKELKELNKIIHPAIIRYLKDELYHLRNKDKIAIIAALWEELKLSDICDKILLITANEKLAFQRIKARDSINKAVYDARIKNQSIPTNPDFAINNEKDFKELYKAINDALGGDL